MHPEAFANLGLRAPAKQIDPPVGPREVASILDAGMRATPDREALADPTRRYSYAELGRAVDAAARLLASLGVRSGDRVAASLPNCCDIVIAFMATQRLGAIWVGINRVLSRPEKLYILRHSGALVVLVDTEGEAVIGPALSDLPDLGHLLVVDSDIASGSWAKMRSSDEDIAGPRVEIDPFAPAAIMYTSGTTGTPKGVVHSQHNLITVCAGMSDAGIQRPQARRGVILPLTIANMMVLGPLMAFWNGQACICGQSVKPAALAEWFRRERIGICASVPTIVYDLIQSDLDLPADLDLRAGGAPLPMAIRNAFMARYGTPIGGSYGLTEAPTVVTETRGIEAPAGSSGLPLPHLRVTIHDADGAVSPQGTIGEICVSAASDGRWANVYEPALGYWHEPDKTGALLRDGVLHTGDVGWVDADGWLYVSERGSDVILRAGSNIYPGEIERILNEHDKVAACALVGIRDARLGMRTAAFVQAAADAPDADTLRAALIELCRESLARYKMPDTWVFVDEFPRNAMGKIIKSRLKEHSDG